MYNQFQELIIDDSLRELASDHAEKRTKEIVRQFIPQNAPLSAVESNYIGALGEIAVRIFLGLNPLLEDNYHHHKVDDGDIEWNGKVYDVKTDAVVSSSYNKIFDGLIKPYEPYACRVWTTKHAHYLPKYTGGLIFCVIEIPNNAKETKYEGVIRDVIFNNDKVLIIGFVPQADVKKNPPTWYTPQNPFSGNRMKYNSENYIFHHSDLRGLKEIK
jgi:hypothetical protein